MRTRAAFLVLLGILLSLLGCDADREVYGPAEVGGPVTSKPEHPDGDVGTHDVPTGTVASMRTDAWSHTNGIALFGYGVSRDTLSLVPSTLWMSHPMGANGHVTSFDIVVRIDPRANAELLSAGHGSLCPGAKVLVMPTGSPGEWRLQASGADCGCGDTAPWDYGGYNLGYLVVKIPTPGEWRAEVGPASATPACACDRGCLSGMAFVGGTLRVGML